MSMKRLLSFALAFTMLFSLASPAYATSDTGSGTVIVGENGGETVLGEGTETPASDTTDGGASEGNPTPSGETADSDTTETLNVAKNSLSLSTSALTGGANTINGGALGSFLPYANIDYDHATEGTIPEGWAADFANATAAVNAAGTTKTETVDGVSFTGILKTTVTLARATTLGEVNTDKAVAIDLNGKQLDVTNFHNLGTGTVTVIGAGKLVGYNEVTSELIISDDLYYEDGSVLPGKRYTVTFVTGDEAIAAPATQKIVSNRNATNPGALTRTGYTFDGWYSGSIEWNFDAPITENKVLTAKWTAHTFTIDFAGDGTLPASLTAIYDQTITLEKLSRENYVFKGWKLDDTKTYEAGTVSAEEVNALYSEAGNNGTITLTAIWNEAVAKVGDVYYETLAEAFAAADESSAAVTLVKDVNADAQLEVHGSYTLDLNGHKIAYTGTSTLASGVVLVLRGANLTIKDSSGNNSGAILSGDKAYAAVALTKAGETSTADAVLTVESGTLTGHYYAVVGNGSRHGTQITVNGGVLTGAEGTAIYHPQSGTLTINDGTLTGTEAAVEIRAGTLNITGGSFTATASPASSGPNGSGTTSSGAAIAIAQHNTMLPISVNISGGTFTGDTAIYESNPQNNPTEKIKDIHMSITGGSFTGTNSQAAAVYVQDAAIIGGFIANGNGTSPVFSGELNEAYAADGFVPEAKGDGKFGVTEAWTVTFMVGDTVYHTTKVAKNASEEQRTVNEPEAPAKADGVFSEWQHDSVPVAFPLPVDNDITLTAVWEEAVAKVCNVGYSSLEAAVDAAQEGDTVTLLVDEISDPVDVNISKSITLDMNNANVGDGINQVRFNVDTNATLTITDSSEDSAGQVYIPAGETSGFIVSGTLVMAEDQGTQIIAADEDVTLITVNAGGRLEVKGGCIDPDCSGCVGIANSGSVEISGGQFNGSPADESSTGSVFVKQSSETAKTTISGGEFDQCELYSGESEDISVSGGTFKDNPTTFVAEGFIAVKREDGSTFDILPGATISFVNYDGTTVLETKNVPAGEAVTYTGVTPTKARDEAWVYIWSGWTDGENSYSKTATIPAATTTDVTYTATFTSRPYVAQIGNDKYATLDEAIGAAASSGSTIVLLEDAELGISPITKSFKIESSGKKITLTGDVTINDRCTIIAFTDLTIDLAGHTITADKRGCIQVGEYYHKTSSLTIEDSDTDGTITGGNYSGDNAPLKMYGSNNCTLILKNDVTVIGTYQGIASGGGKVIVEDNATVYGGTYGVKNTATSDTITELSYSGNAISGGTKAAWGPAEVTVAGKTYYGKTVSGVVTKIPADGTEYTVTAYSSDASLSGTVIQNGQKVVVDLNGQTSALRDDVKIYEGHLTIKNGTVNYGSQDRLIMLYASDDEMKAAGEYNSLTIEDDATITTTVVIYPAGYGTASETNKAYGTKVTIDGTIVGTSQGGVSINGTAHEGNSVIDVNGAVRNTSGLGIYLAGVGITNINSVATVTGLTGIEVRAGELNVTGGTITGGTGVPTNTPESSGSSTTNAGIAIAQHVTQLPISVNVSDSPVVTGGSALYIVNPEENTETINAITVEISGTPDFDGTTVTGDERADITVSGGLFDTKVRVEDCADGLVPGVDTETGKETVVSGHKVSFELNGGSGDGDYSMQGVPTGQKATKPANDPVKANYVFKEWKLNGATFNFETVIVSDITLTAAYNDAVASITTGESEQAVTTYFATFAAAAEARADDNTVITLLADAGEYTLKTPQDILKVEKSGFTLTVKAPEKYEIVESADEGVTTYSATAITFNVWVGGTQITAPIAEDVFDDGKVSYNDTTKTLTLKGYTYSGEGYEKSAIYATGDLSIVVEGTNSLTSTAASGFGVYTGGSLTVNGNGETPTLNVSAASTGDAFWAKGTSASFTGVTITLAAKRGIVVNDNEAGDATLVIENSKITGAGQIRVWANGNTGDASASITKSTVTLTAAKGVELESFSGNATVNINNSTVSITATTSTNGAINVGARSGNGNSATVNITNDSDVTLQGALSGLNVWTWGEAGTEMSTSINVTDSKLTANGYYYGVSSYAYPKGDTVVEITNSTASLSGGVSGVELCSDASYNCVGNKTYKQTNSNVTVTGGYYGLDVDTSTASRVNTGDSVVIITGGSLTSNGGLYVSGDSADSSVTMAGDVTIDMTGIESISPIATDNLNIASGTYTIVGADGDEIIADGNITGGYFNTDVSGSCSEGYGVFPNTDDNKDEYPYKVLPISGAVASIGSIYYPTLADAVAAAVDGDTITMLANETISSYVTINSDITLDLAGWNIIRTGGNCALDVYGIVTLKDSRRTENDETVYGKVQGVIPVWVNNGGKFTLESGAIEAINAVDTGATGIRADGNAEVTLKGGSVTSAKWGVTMFDTSKLEVNDGASITATSDAAICTNGNSGQNATVTIKGGAVTSTNEIAVYIPSGTLNVSGGTITGKTAVYFKSNNLSITGGSLIATGDAAEYSYYGNGANATGDALVIDNCGYPNGISSISVTGGYFESANAQPIASYANGQEGGVDRTPKTKFVSAVLNDQGEITSAPSFNKQLALEYCADDFMPSTADLTTGMYTVVDGPAVAIIEAEGEDTQYFVSLAAAVEAAQSGDTITMIADDHVSLTNGGILYVNKSLTITGPVDSNGAPLYTIYGQNNSKEENGLYLDTPTPLDVTISNVKFSEFGNNAATNSEHCVISVESSCADSTVLTLNNVTIEKYNKIGVWSGKGTLEMTGCTIDGAKSNDNGDVLTNGVQLYGNGTITNCIIRNFGSTYSSWNAAGIQLDNSGAVTITGCTITSSGPKSIGVISTNNATVPATISTSTVTGVRRALYINRADSNSNGFVVNSGTFDGGISKFGASTCNIYGGKFENFEVGTGSNTVNPVIYGGNFDTNPTNFVAEGYIAVERENDFTFDVLSGATITFVNYDGTTELEKKDVVKDRAVVYTGITPSKPADDQGIYTWTGWTTTIGETVYNYLTTDELPVATQVDVIYTATYSSVDSLASITRGEGEQAVTTYYPSLAAAIDDANAGDTITILKDFTIDASKTEVSDRIVVDKAVTIDFGPYTMSVPGSLEPTANWAALFIDADTTLTASIDPETGKTGGIDCLNKASGEVGVYAINVRNNAALTIEGGNYHGGGTIIQAQLGTVEITGGTFTLTPFDAPYGSDFALNCVDTAYASHTAGFEVKGGTFVGFDPQNNKAEGANTRFVPANYVALDPDKDGTFVVKEGYTVTFNVNGGTPEIAEQRIEKSDIAKATEPATIPTTPTGVFKEWRLNDTAYDFDTILSADITLVAYYEDAVASVTHTAGGVTTTVGYPSLTAAVDAAFDGDTVTLLQDVTLSTALTMDGVTKYGVVINKSITLDGGDHTITSGTNRTIGIMGPSSDAKIDVTIKNLIVNNNNSGGGAIFTRGNLYSLTLEDVELNMSGSGYTQPITISGNTQNNVAQVTIKDSKLISHPNCANGYAIINWVPAEFTITGSTIKGWACLYAKPGSEGTSYTVDQSKLISKNLNAGQTNAFGVIVYEADYVTATVTNTEIDVSGTDNTQAIVTFSTWYASSSGYELTHTSATFGEGNTVSMLNDAQFATKASNDGYDDGGLVVISAGTFDRIVDDQYCAPSKASTTVVDEHGMYHVVDAWTVTYMDGEDVYAIDKVAKGEEATTEYLPTKEGKAFVGWENATGELVTYPLTVEADMTLNSVWVDAVAKLTWVIDEDNTFDFYYASLADAIDDANAALLDEGESITITLLKDETIDGNKTAENDRIVIEAPITLDFGTNKLIVPGSLEPTANWAALFVDADTTLKATTGGIDCLDKEDGEVGVYAINVRNNAKLTIEGGSYHGGGTIVQAQLGTVEIKGGTFTLTPYDDPYGSDFALNCKDDAYAAHTAGFTITGGTFVGFDPQDNKSEGANTDYTAANYVAIKDGDNYVVQPGWNVIFDSDGGSEVAAERIAAGGKAVAPDPAPTKASYAFKEWQLNDTAYDFDTVLSADIKLTAVYDEAVASITSGTETVYFATLAKAFAAVENGQTIVLMKDAALTSGLVLNSEREITLDLNGHTTSGQYVDLYNEFLTVVDNGETKGAFNNLVYVNVGKDVNAEAGAYNSFTLAAGAKMNNNVYVYQNDTNKGYGTQVDINGTMNGLIFVLGNIHEGNTVVNVTGTINSSDDVAIALNGFATVNVSNGAVISAQDENGKGTGIEVRAGTLNVSGGTITGHGAPTSVNPNGSGTTSTGAAIAVSQHTTKLPITVNITGGTFNGYSAFYESNPQGNTAEDVARITLSISGGTFNTTEGGTKAVYSQDKTKFISGGTYPNADVYTDGYCAVDYYAEANTSATTYTVVQCTEHEDNNHDGLCDLCGHRIGSLVTVTSSGNGTAAEGNPMAFVAGGGVYTKGTEFTVKAEKVSGYEFDGWYYVGGDKITGDLQYTFTADGENDYKLVAVYKTDNTFHLTITGSRFTVTGYHATQRSRMDADIKANQDITIKFTGSEKFLYWINSSNKVLSRNAEYTFRLTHDTAITAVYSDATNTEALVVFVSAKTDGQVISSCYYNTDDAEIAIPAAPASMGKVFNFWSIDGVNPATNEAIKAAISSSSGRIEIYPVYSQTNSKYSITVVSVDGNGHTLETDDSNYQNIAVGTASNLTVDEEIGGAKFSYWSDKPTGGMILSYSTNYHVRPAESITLYAVYAGTSEAKPTIVMTDAFATMNGSNYRVSFTATRSVPDTYTVQEQGILRIREEQLDTTSIEAIRAELVLNSENPNVKVMKDSNTGLTGTTTGNTNTSVEDRVFYARGYMILINAAGETEYVYSDNVLFGSYLSLTTD